MPTIEIQIDDDNQDAFEDDNNGGSTDSTVLRCEANTSASSRYNALMVFKNVPLPKIGDLESVDNAFVSVVFPFSSRDSPDLDWYFNNVDSAADHDTESDVTGRARTTATVNWSGTDLGFGSGVFTDSPDLTTIVEEIITRSGWSPENNMAALADGEDGTTGSCRLTSHNSTPADACRLTIDYEPKSAGGQLIRGGSLVRGNLIRGGKLVC